MDRIAFRTILLHEFRLGHKVTETVENVNKAWGDGTAAKRTVQRWFQKFRNGNESLEDKEKTGRPSDVDDDLLKQIVQEDPRQSVSDIALKMHVSKSTAFEHLKSIGKVKKMDKWVPHDLTEIHMKTRLEIATSLLRRHSTDPFLDRIITCDEKWIVYDNRKRSAQWLSAHESPKEFPKMNLHPKKCMVTVWWSTAGVIHFSFLKTGDTITGTSYCEQLEEMHKKLVQKQPSLVNRKGPILLHDNARPHVSRIVVQKLHELGYETLPHPPYSPDLAPTDFHFFKHLEHFLKNKEFKNQCHIETAFKDFISSKNPDFFQIGINKLLSRWQKCIDSNGAYF